MQQYLSNELEDFQGGGLYPGGTGTIREIKYVLWDYEGKQPKDSVLAVRMIFDPKDGSNDGKPLEQFWSAGDASEFVISPDGGHIAAAKARTAQNDNTNWATVLKAFRDQCGLEKGKLSGPTGIRALEGSTVTLARVDQKKREGLETNEEKEKKGYKPTILIPIKATYPWEVAAPARRGAAAAPASAPTATATAPATPAPAAGDLDAASVIKATVQANGNNVSFAELTAKALEYMTANVSGIGRAAKMNISKQIKEAVDGSSTLLETVATEMGWELTDTHIQG